MWRHLRRWFYIGGGLLFMLLPGAFLGAWNLIAIGGRRAAESVSPTRRGAVNLVITLLASRPHKSGFRRAVKYRN